MVSNINKGGTKIWEKKSYTRCKGIYRLHIKYIFTQINKGSGGSGSEVTSYWYLIKIFLVYFYLFKVKIYSVIHENIRCTQSRGLSGQNECHCKFPWYLNWDVWEFLLHLKTTPKSISRRLPKICHYICILDRFHVTKTFTL